MSAGGYIYEQVDLAYDANTNGATVRSWALVVHIARCKAFLLAAQREALNFGGQGWSVIQTNLYNEFYEDHSGTYIYVQDIHPTTVDTTSEYPAFVTFFKRNNNSEEYCIITYSGFNAYDDYSDQTTYYSYGLYMPRSSLQMDNGGIDYVSCGGSMAHAFAKSGFGNYDVCSASFLTTDCTHIMPAYMHIYGRYYNYNSSSYSIVGARSNSISNSNLVSKTFQFGFAIKGTQIIAFERRLDANGWLWSIIGEIFDTLIDPNDTHKVGCIVNDYYSHSQYEVSDTHDTMVEGSETPSSSISFCNTSGIRYKPSNSSIYLTMTRSINYFAFSPCSRTDNTIPSDTRYNAVGVGAVLIYYVSPTGDLGVDGHSNGGKGFIDTDLLRQVSAGVCQNVGATFQTGNFVAMKCYPSQTAFGYILGWDNSNQSIM